MMLLTETVTSIYGVADDLDVVVELCLDDKHPRDLLSRFNLSNQPIWTDHVIIDGCEYYTDYRKDFPCGRPRSHTSNDSCFAQFLEDLRNIDRS
jgi:hypothetical protein